MSRLASGVAALFRSLWRVLDGLRRIVHLFLMLLVAMVLLAMLLPRTVTVPETAALNLTLSGQLVEQLSGDPLQRAFAEAQGRPPVQTRVLDVVESLRRARDDERIRAVVLQLDDFTGGGLSKLREVADALVAFRESGKPVIVYGDAFTQAQYYLAAHADEIYMHPQGSVVIGGYGSYRPYFREALEWLLVDVHVVQVGEYKAMAEPFLRDDMSPEDREMSELYLQHLWQTWLTDVAAARGLAAESIEQYVTALLSLSEQAEGNLGQVALEMGLIDNVAPRDALEQRMAELVPARLGRSGGEDAAAGTFSRIGFTAYLEAQREPRRRAPAGDEVAVVVASGNILPGTQPPGAIGDESLVRLVREARLSERVRALVLRIDSGGGSAFASDVILRELQRFQETGRPLVASLGSVAASGGYWIAMSGDQIWASPTTLTGSIGVVGLFPTFQRSLEHLGVHIDGVGTTWLAGELRPDRPLSPDARRLLELSVHDLYARFIDNVAQYRGMTPQQVDQLGRGRIWTGEDARELGLVDALGQLDDAVASAAALAGLEEGAYGVRFLEPEPSFAQLLLTRMAHAATPALSAVARARGGEPLGGLQGMLRAVESELRILQGFGDPRGVAAYCFCEPY